MSSSKSIKKRYWAFVLYPESAPDDWKEKLQATGLPCAISPLHDKDINPGTNEPKKEHYHVLACYSGPTTFNSVKTLTDSLSCPIPIPLESVRGYYRYLTHMDNPEKHQYDEKDIQTLNGFDISDFVELSKSEIHNIILRLETLIKEADFIEYSDVCDYLRDKEMISEHDVFCSHTMHFTSLLRSRRYKKMKKALVDPESGELINGD
jgi:hypothetical protein